jgi:peptide/nickel transport system permease protein
MWRYLTKRLLHAVLVVVGVSIIVFGMSYLAGDPTPLMLPQDATTQDIAEYRVLMGFDQPVHVQYWNFARGALTGNFGKSFMQGEDAMKLVLDRLPASLKLALVSFAISLLVAVPAGVLAAVKRGSVLDHFGKVLALIGQCLPNFYLGILLILFVSVRLRWLPATGSETWQGLILPGITLGLYVAAETMRLLRSSLLEVLNLDYIKTARSKGLTEKVVILRHAFKNAALPVVTVLGLQFGTLMGRAVVTETVFSYPGMGLLAVKAIANRDFLLIQAFVIVMAVIVIVLNLCVDMLYVALDPRVRHS